MDPLDSSTLCHICESIVHGIEFERAIETLDRLERESKMLPAGTIQGGYYKKCEPLFWLNRQKLKFHTFGELELASLSGEFCPLCHFILDNMVKRKGRLSDPECRLFYSVECEKRRVPARLSIGTAEVILINIYLSLPASTFGYI